MKKFVSFFLLSYSLFKIYILYHSELTPCLFAAGSGCLITGRQTQLVRRRRDEDSIITLHTYKFGFLLR